MPVKKTLLKTEAMPFKCYTTYHPSAVLMGGFQFEDKILDDLKRFKFAPLKQPKDAVPDGKSKYIGFDTEYDSEGKLLTLGAADHVRAVAVETTERRYMDTIRKVLRRGKVLVGHSVSGDLDHLVLLGLANDDWLRGKNVRDSFLLARMHNENGGKGAYGLETLLLSKFNTDGWKAETEKLIKKTGNAADWTPEQRIARCRLDAWATVVLADYFEKELLNERNEQVDRVR